MADVAGDRRILDLACGTGNVTELILGRVGQARKSLVIGLEHSTAALQQAMKEVKAVGNAAVTFVQSNVERVAEAVKESVDTVVFCNAIHYIPDKDALLTDIAKTLKKGGKFAFNTSFFNGGIPPEARQFYRRWMLRSLRLLRRDYGLSPEKSKKVESRKQLTPDEYRGLLEEHGFRVVKQELDPVEMPLEAWFGISEFKDFIEGVMPGVPYDKGSATLKKAVKETYSELGIDGVPRIWLNIVAERS